jgi:hypothetical protein
MNAHVAAILRRDDDGAAGKGRKSSKSGGKGDGGTHGSPDRLLFG